MTSTTEKPTGTGAGAGPGDGLSLPTTNNPHQTGSRDTSGLRIRDWVRSPRSGESRYTGRDGNGSGSGSGSGSGPGPGPGTDLAPPVGGGRGPKKRDESWWKIHFFRGMINDVRKRAPYYVSDWTDAWNYRVVPATVYMFFAKSV